MIAIIFAAVVVVVIVNETKQVPIPSSTLTLDTMFDGCVKLMKLPLLMLLLRSHQRFLRRFQTTRRCVCSTS